ncbi:MAG TPA: hypothetical protein VH370_10715, partial [Humisphaera sp.]|nr:hypothetical protein [Humisphaera sp.]
PGSPTKTASVYIAFDASKNLVTYGSSSVSTDNTQQPPVTTTTTVIAMPPIIFLPAVMVAGQVYSGSTTLSGQQVKSPGGTTDNTVVENYTTKLVSDTLQKVNVPAGTFMCYEVQRTETLIVGKNSIVSSSTEWDAPGVPQVKKIEVGSLDTSTTLLTSIGAKKTPTKLAFGTQPSDVSVNAAMSPPLKVDVEDNTSAIVASDTSSVTLTIATGPVGGTISGGLATASGGVATFSNLKFTKPGKYSLKATDGTLTSAISQTFMVNAQATATKLAFAVQPATTVAGKTIAPAVKVDVELAGGAIALADASTVTLALASGPGTLGGTLTAKAVNGVATFSSLLLTKAGKYTLKATDGALTFAVSNSFMITPAAAAKLAFAANPASAVAGKPITPAVAVDVEDKFGNIVTTNVSKVTLAIAGGAGPLGGPVSVLAKAGVATFPALILTKAGSYTLKATDALLTAATSKAFTITAAAASKLVFAAVPAATLVGKAIAPALAVDVEDKFGNIVKSDISKVSIVIASGPTGGLLTGGAALAATSGVATFANLKLSKAGTYTLKAIDGLLTPIVSAAFKVS